ncbi:MAG: DUF1080 domain-containing protein, partial [Planctomycetes bacterium]|nr:DUF1080 domain-containing protein [Planctomycetota bacterium]
LNAPGQYNHSRIVVRGNHIEHWLNGERVVQAETGSDDWQARIAGSKFANVERFAQNSKGRIQIQDHGSKVWFRKILLRPLAAGGLWDAGWDEQGTGPPSGSSSIGWMQQRRCACPTNPATARQVRSRLRSTSVLSCSNMAE